MRHACANYPVTDEEDRALVGGILAMATHRPDACESTDKQHESVTKREKRRGRCCNVPTERTAQ